MKYFAVFSLICFTSLNLSNVDGLKCYECSSNNNPNCSDPFKAEDTLIECPKAPLHIRHLTDKTEAIFCRKIRQLVEGGKYQITTRSCGYLKNNETGRDADNLCFKDAFTAYSSSVYCYCSGDNCNSANGRSYSNILIVLLLTATFSIFSH